MNAIIETGGKQYKVTPGQVIKVDHLGIGKGDNVEFDRVLLINDEGKFIEGRPVIEGAKVTATSLGDKRGEKILIGKFKAKTRYRRKMGHRQMYTTLTIDKILSPGAAAETPEAEPKKVRRTTKKAEVTTDGT